MTDGTKLTVAFLAGALTVLIFQHSPHAAPRDFEPAIIPGRYTVTLDPKLTIFDTASATLYAFHETNWITFPNPVELAEAENYQKILVQINGATSNPARPADFRWNPKTKRIEPIPK